MNHLTLYTGEFFIGLSMAVPFTIVVLLYANHRANTIING